MTNPRGFTVVETLLASVLTAILVGALISVFGFVTNRTAKAYAQSAAVRQASQVGDEISTYVANALDVSLVTVNGQVCLKCTMPYTGRFANGNKRYDLYEPDAIKALGMESFNPGQRVWFYMGDAAGNPISTGTAVHKAARADDINPAAADVETAWERYPGSGPLKYPLVNGLVWSADGTYKFVSFTLYASAASGNEKTADVNTATTNRYDVKISRRVLARNYR